MTSQSTCHCAVEFPGRRCIVVPATILTTRWDGEEIGRRSLRVCDSCGCEFGVDGVITEMGEGASCFDSSPDEMRSKVK